MSQDTESANVGEPHPDDSDPNAFTGSDPSDDVGEPDDLGGQIGQPGDPSGTLGGTTMQDLSSLLPGDPVSALAPTSQAAGNQRHDNSQAMTAPGTVPASPLTGMPGEVTVHEAPVIGATAYDTPVLIGPGGAKVTADNADRTNPFTEPDGAGWRSGRDTSAPDVLPETRGKPRISLGQWNEV